MHGEKKMNKLLDNLSYHYKYTLMSQKNFTFCWIVDVAQGCNVGYGSNDRHNVRFSIHPTNCDFTVHLPKVIMSFSFREKL